jgi:hypothetical protein
VHSLITQRRPRGLAKFWNLGVADSRPRRGITCVPRLGADSAGAVVVDGHIVASAVVHLTGSNRHIQFCAGIRARQLARLLLP